MPPNTVDLTPVDPEAMMKNTKPVDFGQPSDQRSEEKYGLMVFQSSLNLLAHILIGMIVAINIMFAFRFGMPLGPTPMHVVLCVVGFQLLMAEAILSLHSENGWTSKMRFVDKRRAHWILQIVGSGLAIGGSFHKVLDKTVNWNTLHGQFALVAMVFTVASMVNGVTALYAYELRRIMPGILSKLTHIIFGIVGFAAASISLIYGMDKFSFRMWASSEVTDTFIAFTVIMTVIVIFNPFITFFAKTKQALKK